MIELWKTIPLHSISFEYQNKFHQLFKRFINFLWTPHDFLMSWNQCCYIYAHYTHTIQKTIMLKKSKKHIKYSNCNFNMFAYRQFPSSLSWSNFPFVVWLFWDWSHFIVIHKRLLHNLYFLFMSKAFNPEVMFYTFCFTFAYSKSQKAKTIIHWNKFACFYWNGCMVSVEICCQYF